MAGQSIKLKIAGGEYSLVAMTPEQESVMRSAAEEINQMKEIYDTKFANRTLQDKLVFVALNQTVAKLNLQKKVTQSDIELNDLDAALSNYLKNID